MRFNRFTSVLAILLATTAGSSGVASAALVTFNSRSNFDTAVGVTTSENFNGVVTDQSFISSPVTVGAMTFSGAAGANGSATQKIDAAPFGISSYTPNGTSFVFADLLNTNSLTIAFAGGITAWGADFLGIADGRPTSLSLFDSGNVLLGSFAFPTAGVLDQRFFGFQLTSGVADHIVFSNSSTNNDAFGIDNVEFASAAVPEPGSLALLGLGLAGLAAIRKRKQA